jgi:hypothetical protein
MALFEDGITLQPHRNTIPDPDMFIEQTGDINDINGRHNTAHIPGTENIHNEADVFPAKEMDVNNQEDIQVAPQIINDGQPQESRPQHARRAPR